jgi:hypothetical protein
MIVARNSKRPVQIPTELFLRDEGDGKVTLMAQVGKGVDWNVLVIDKDGIRLSRSIGRDVEFALDDECAIAFLGTD